MSATVSDFLHKVAAIVRNRWPTCSGLGGRHGSELLADLLRIMQLSYWISFLGAGQYHSGDDSN